MKKLLDLLIMTTLTALAATLARADDGHDPAHRVPGRFSPTLVEKVRNATERFRDINVAIAEGFVQGTPCVSGPDFGAMGVHFVQSARIANAVLKAEEPEALIYEPQANGAFRLVGVEFIILKSVWGTQHSDGSTPALDGNLLNFVNEPNRYGLHPFYEIHVWAWEDNPQGSFADWNTRVTCEKQRVSS